MNITVEISGEDKVRAMLKAFPKRAKSACRRSVNRAAQGVSTDSAKAITAEYRIKKKDVSAVMKRTKAAGERLFAQVAIGGKKLPLDKFRYSPKDRAKKAKRGIKVYMRKGSATVFNGTFLGNSKNAKSGEGTGLKIFKRLGKKRLPIKRLLGPAVWQMLKDDSIKTIEANAAERLAKNFEHEISRGHAFT